MQLTAGIGLLPLLTASQTDFVPLAGLRPEPGDIEARDGLLLPGFIDIHIHGGGGRYVMDGTRDALDAVATHLAKFGVTGFLSTTITAPWEAKAQALDVAAKAMR